MSYLHLAQTKFLCSITCQLIVKLNELYILNIMKLNQFLIYRVQLLLSLMNLRCLDIHLVMKNSIKNMLNLVLSNIDMFLKMLTV